MGGGGGGGGGGIDYIEGSLNDNMIDTLCIQRLFTDYSIPRQIFGQINHTINCST